MRCYGFHNPDVLLVIGCLLELLEEDHVFAGHQIGDW